MREAAALVRHGWCRSALHKTPDLSDSGRHEYCAVGALMKAGIWGSSTSVKRLFESTICGLDVVQWNNTIAKDGEEVAQKFELAAELAELDEQHLLSPEVE